MEHLQILWVTCSSVLSLSQKRFFFHAIANLNLFFFQFEIIPPCSVTTCPCKKTLSSFLTGSLQALEGHSLVILKPSLFQVGKIKFSQAFPTARSINQLAGPPLGLLQQVHILPVLGITTRMFSSLPMMHALSPWYLVTLAILCHHLILSYNNRN